MSGFAAAPFLTGLALSAAVALGLLLLTWLVSLVVGRVNVVDSAWGLVFVAVAVASFAWSAGHGTDTTRRILVLALTAAWGLRLAAYITVRSVGKGEDPRYAALLGDGSPRRRALRALGIVFVLQALIAWVVSLPVQAAMEERAATNALTWVGTAVWVVGLFFEAVGDAQLARFRADPTTRGTVMDRGLWRYTRHPNYFGDAAVWTGLWLIAAQQWVGAVTVVSLALMVWFLSAKSGKPLLERHLAATRAGYADYVARTSGFVPLPPGSRLARSRRPPVPEETTAP